MNTYLMIMLPISSIYLLIMLVLLFAFERAKRAYWKMIKGGYYFVWNGGSFIGVPPDTANMMGLTSQRQTTEP